MKKKLDTDRKNGLFFVLLKMASIIRFDSENCKLVMVFAGNNICSFKPEDCILSLFLRG